MCRFLVRLRVLRACLMWCRLSWFRALDVRDAYAVGVVKIVIIHAMMVMDGGGIVFGDVGGSSLG